MKECSVFSLIFRKKHCITKTILRFEQNILKFLRCFCFPKRSNPSVPQDIHKISNRYPGLDVVDINSGYPLDIHQTSNCPGHRTSKIRYLLDVVDFDEKMLVGFNPLPISTPPILESLPVLTLATLNRFNFTLIPV